MENEENMRFEDTIRKLIVVTVSVVLIVSIAGLYISLNSFIDIWAGYRYASLYKIIMNLAVLIIAVYILSKLMSKN